MGAGSNIFTNTVDGHLSCSNVGCEILLDFQMHVDVIPPKINKVELENDHLQTGISFARVPFSG